MNRIEQELVRAGVPEAVAAAIARDWTATASPDTAAYAFGGAPSACDRRSGAAAS